VRTVHGVGYAFVGETVPAAGVALASPFRLRWGGQEFPLVQGANLVGRSPACDVRIPSTRVSRLHSRLVVAGGLVTIEDLGSKNGTHIKGQRVSGPTLLRGGEEILLGHEAVLFVAASPSGSTKTDQLS
jgi:pSer/pThr/pTyr-binding forkhead associated (FHA) protein